MKNFYDSFKSIAIAMAMIMPVAANAADIGTNFTSTDGLKYRIIAEGEVAVVSNGYDGYRGEFNVPASVEYDDATYAVTTLGDGNDLFGQSTTAVTLSEGLTTINSYAFSMASIKELELPSTLTTIGGTAFFNIKIETLTIPDKVSAIPANCLYACDALYELTLGSGVKSIGRAAFGNCKALAILNMKTTEPPTLDEVAFGTTINDEGETVTVQPTYVTVVVPEGCLEAYQEAWGERGFMAIVDNEEDIPEINPEEETFTVNDYTYKKLGGNEVAMIACTTAGSNITPSPTTLYEGIAYNITTLGGGTDRVFSQATGVTLPEGLVTIKNKAFNNSTIQTVKLPNSLKTLEEGAFRQSRIRELTIPSMVEEIPARCFMGSSYLSEITFGEGVKTIGDNATVTCNALEVLNFISAEPPTLSETSIPNCANIVVYVPVKSKQAYIDAWGDYGFKEILAEGEEPGGDPDPEPPVGIDEIEVDALTYVVTADGIQLSANVDEMAAVYSVSGQLLANGICTDGFIPVRLTAGIYLLRIGDTTLKILVK